MQWRASVDENYRQVIVELARKATTLRPDAVKNWQTLASELLRAGEINDAIDALNQAVSRLPEEPAPYLMLADAYYRVRQPERAAEILRRAPAVPTGNKELVILRLKLLAKTCVGSDLVRIAHEILSLDPTNGDGLAALEKSAREGGRPEIVISACERALAHEPGHTRARYQLAVACALLGRNWEARQLIDLHQFVEVIDTAVPAGYGSAAAFETALAGEIRRNPTLEPDPVGKATRNGTQTSHYPGPRDEAAAHLLQIIRSAIDEFAAQLPNVPTHPFVENRPHKVALHAWGIVYPGEGRQTSHIHPDGWLSGVYYVSVPGTDDQHGGALVLGALDEKNLNGDPPWGTRHIRPAPGQLVLFPSYIPHAVIPTKSPDYRICVAFDVVPSPRDLPDANFDHVRTGDRVLNA